MAALRLVKRRQAVHDAIGAHLFGVVDQKRDAGAHAGLDQHVRDRRPVLLEHDPDLVQHRGHGGQPGGPGQPFGVLADQTVDGQREFVGGDLGFGADPPLLHNFCVIPRTGEQAHDGVGVADVDCE